MMIIDEKNEMEAHLMFIVIISKLYCHFYMPIIILKYSSIKQKANTTDSATIEKKI